MILQPKTLFDVLSEIPAIKKFNLNKKGRDFVVGDIHGHYTRFMKLLDAVKFDPTVDRIFSSGDLVDRGPENEDCLRLLHNDWFHASLGNHEFFVLSYFHRLTDKHLWIGNGGAWASTYINAIVTKTFNPSYNFTQDAAEFWWELVPQIKRMPMMMSVRMKNWKKFHVVHAELNTTKFKITDKKLLDEKFVRKVWTNETNYGGEVYGECDGMWRRSIFNDGDVESVHAIDTMKLSTVYSGHTIQSNGPTECGPFICLDTGSFLGNRKNYGISIIEPETRRVLLSNEFGVSEIKINKK